jgi:CheY-like chemotaxis protein
VLIVEDEPTNREVATFMLEDLRQVVDLAVNGEEAVAQAAVNAYHLILMDIQMPGMDGLEATRRIRRLPQGQLVPILAMTANVFAEDRARCLDAGMDGLVGKPIDPIEFYGAILEALRWADAPHERPESAPWSNKTAS